MAAKKQKNVRLRAKRFGEISPEPWRRRKKPRRRLRYQVAVSLDGFIAGPNGEADWIVMDSSIDFGALYNEFDTAVMGRKTYEAGLAMGGRVEMPGIDVVVFSQTLPPSAYPGVRITNHDPAEIVAQLKAKPGKDIWLFGGGELFRTLLDAGQVDSVEVAVVPVLLGSGIPLLPPGASTKLVLVDQKTLSRSGIVVMSYTVPGGGPAPPIRFVKSKSRASKKTASKKTKRPSKRPGKSRRRRV
jgi:dihydrofolate reductase